MTVERTVASNTADREVVAAVSGGTDGGTAGDSMSSLSRERSAVRRTFVLFLVLGLFTWFFCDVLFRDRNFVYRDASQFYYPLLKLVQAEWDAGRWPLWNPHENSGMPLLGNPASAVLYVPRIVLFQWLPISYGTAFKWYTLSHVLLCAFGAWLLSRHWGMSEFAAGLAALSYAFAAAVIFQYCNVIFLVGAAWIPLGLYTADRAFGMADWRWACAHGLVLAMQLFGGDPEAAYVTGGLSAIYVALKDRVFACAMAGLIALLYLAKWGLQQRLPRSPDEWVLPGCALLALATVLWLFWRLRRRGSDIEIHEAATRRRRRMCLGLSAAVALGVSAVQWIPSWEFGRISNRAAGGIHYEPYAFWIAPWRLAEFVWPNVTGCEFPTLSRWIDIISVDDKMWEPSLYFGGVPLLLALTAIGLRRVEHWRRWMTLVLVISLWASTGPAGGITWYWNSLQKMSPPEQPDGGVARGADQAQANPKGRPAPQMQTPAGGLYWVMLELLPGFDTFRYPAKLMTFAAVAFALLAGYGWDRVFSTGGSPPRGSCPTPGALPQQSPEPHPAPHHSPRGDGRGLPLSAGSEGWPANRDAKLTREEERVKGATPYVAQSPVRLWVIIAIVMASVFLTLAALVMRSSVIARLSNTRLAIEGSLYYGQLRPDLAWNYIAGGFITTAVAGSLILSCRRYRSRPIAAWLQAGLLTAFVLELGFANGWLIETSEQSSIDAVPKIAQILQDAEAADPSGEPEVPMRIHRVSAWSLARWIKSNAPDRPDEIFQWEKATIQPKHGLPYGINYTINEGTLEPYDYWWFFAPFFSNTTPEPRSVVYYPQRGFDMWGARYFVLPHGYKPDDQHRGFVTFLRRSTLVAESVWTEDDYQVRRNPNAYPRGWIVHKILYRKPIEGFAWLERNNLMREILYEGLDPLWRERELDDRVQDPRHVAWIEDPDPGKVLAYQDPDADPAADRCRFVRYEPDRVEIEAETAGRGVLIVAELLYPGWKVTVDGRPGEILRANRMMRGVALTPGTHRVVFTFEPFTVRLGAWVTIISLVVTVVSLVVGSIRRFAPRV